ncbi:MAG: HYExAFE family protein [Planctomycetes bacterium]|nr:HYExAFE family protein [Planctomycetota bacterium]
MAQRRFHYEQAFEHYLRARSIAYVAVDEARRALTASGGRAAALPIKSFDFVVYSKRGANLLVEIKGRKHSGKTGKALQNWVSKEDLAGLPEWGRLFGGGFEPAFVFMFWCDTEPPDALFQDMFEFNGRWYAVLAVRLSGYAPVARPRSPKWGTVSVPAKAFHAAARPLTEML